MTTPGTILYTFFEQHLKAEKGLRPASVRSYRDALRLFLTFVARHSRRKITRLRLADLTAERVRQFLNYLETERGNNIRTRNHRLAVLHTFFDFVAAQVPEAIAEAERVAAIPIKRAASPPTHFLERDQVEALFAGLPAEGPLVLRDRALLLFLYNTGARAQEVADLRVGNLLLEPQPRVHLHGKGDKWRTCPLWPETARLLRKLFATRLPEPRSDDPVFISVRGHPLTRFGLHKIVRRHTRALVVGTAGEGRGVSPHIFRHTTAVHLLEAGVEVNVIRGWLGHVSLDTTNRYAEINIRMKEAALRTCELPESSEAFPRRAVWRDDDSLLKWLESL